MRIIAKTNISAFLILELIASVLFIAFFGFLNFFMIVCFSMILGIIILTKSWVNISSMKNALNIKNLFSDFAFVIAGFLLAVPGILSSFLGFLLLVFVLVLKLFSAKKTRQNQENMQDYNNEEEIIDVEIIEEKR